MALSEEDRRKIHDLAGYFLDAGFDVSSIVSQMERLKFEQITTGRSACEITAEASRRRNGPLN